MPRFESKFIDLEWIDLNDFQEKSKQSKAFPDNTAIYFLHLNGISPLDDTQPSLTLALQQQACVIFSIIDEEHSLQAEFFQQLQAMLQTQVSFPLSIHLLTKAQNHGYDGFLKCLAKEFPHILWSLYDISAFPAFLTIQPWKALAQKAAYWQALIHQKQEVTDLVLPSAANNFNELILSKPQENQLLIQYKTLVNAQPIAYHWYQDHHLKNRLLALKQDCQHRKPVLLVTGGAKGITYRCLYELYGALTHEKHKNPSFEHPLLHLELYLIGQTKIKKQTTPTDDREALLDRILFKAPMEYEHLSLTALKQKLKDEPCLKHPKEVDLIAKEAIAQFELKHHLVKLSKIYPHIHYYPMNIRSKVELTQLYEALDDQNRVIFGLIHGAGLIEDKKFLDKTWDSFDRVVRTKLDFLDNIKALEANYPKRWLKPFTESFVVYFSSVSAAIGNLGQADYAYANAYLDRYATKHLSLQWGPWFGAGMVSPTLAKYYQKLGIKMIHIDEGTHAFIEEVLSYEANQEHQHQGIVSLRSYPFDRG